MFSIFHLQFARVMFGVLMVTVTPCSGPAPAFPMWQEIYVTPVCRGSSTSRVEWGALSVAVTQSAH